MRPWARLSELRGRENAARRAKCGELGDVEH